MAPRIRKIIVTSLRIVICVVALGWVLRSVTIHDYVTLRDGRSLRLLRLDGDRATVQHSEGRQEQLSADQIALKEDGTPRIAYGLGSILTQSRKSYLLWAVLIFAPVPLLQSLRFLMMFRAQDIRLSFWECVKLSVAGNFLNFVALGSTGGDVVKAYYVCLHTDRRTEAITTILLDRVVGLTGLVATVGLILLFCSTDPRLSIFGSFSVIFLAAVVVGSTVLVSETARSWVRRLLPVGRSNRLQPPDADAGTGSTRKLSRAFTWIAGQFRRVDETTRRLIRHKPLVLGTVLITMVLQLMAMTAFQAIVFAVRMPWDTVRAWDYYVYLGCGTVVAVLPITPQGVGTVEAFYKEFLVGNGVTVAQILCLAMAVRFLMLLWALPGFFVSATGAYRPRKTEAPSHPVDEPA